LLVSDRVVSRSSEFAGKQICCRTQARIFDKARHCGYGYASQQGDDCQRNQQLDKREAPVLRIVHDTAP
jgi:hypothetical protein